MVAVQKELYDRGGYIIPALINDITLHSDKLGGFVKNETGNADFKYRYRRVWFNA
jgi:hypothetical protein